MRERRKLLAKQAEGTATRKWLFYSKMNYLDKYVQHKKTLEEKTRDDIPLQPEVVYLKPESSEHDNSESDIVDSSNQHPEDWGSLELLDTDRGYKKPRLSEGEVPYFEILNRTTRRIEAESNDSDRSFLLSLLPAMKELPLLDNMDFRVEVQETLRRIYLRSRASEQPSPE
jgi:hypothetical protein